MHHARPMSDRSIRRATARTGACVPVSVQRGVGLIEIMVALVILSIGLLGIANLHMAGLRMTQEAYFQSQATILAQDIIDRMRANPDAAEDGDYLRAHFADAEERDACAPVVMQGDLAQQDVALWLQALACGLPGGDGTVAQRADGIYRVVVRWDARDGEGRDGHDLVVTEVQL